MEKYRLMFVVLYVAGFVAAFNENIINTAIPDMVEYFGVSSATCTWLVTGYMMVTTVVVTCSAFIYNRFTLRGIFSVSCLFFGLGLLGALLSSSFWILLAFRLIQAIGTGLFIPTMTNSILTVTPKYQLGSKMAIAGCMIAFGPAFGPVTSGVMTTFLGWRFIFLPPLIVTVFFALAGFFILKNVNPRQEIRLDPISVILIGIGLLLLIYALSIILTNLFFSLILLLLGIGLLALFALRQRKIRFPLLNLSPLLNKQFYPCILLIFSAMLVTFSLSVLLPLYYQNVFFLTAFYSGSLILIPILVNALTATIGGKLYDKFGAWPLLSIGFVVICLGQIGIVITSLKSSILLVTLAAIVVYAGIGIVFSQIQTTGLSRLKSYERPHGVSIINTCIMVAASLGPSLLVGIVETLSNSYNLNGNDTIYSYAKGFSTSILVSAIITMIVTVVCTIYTIWLHKLDIKDRQN